MQHYINYFIFNIYHARSRVEWDKTYCLFIFTILMNLLRAKCIPFAFGITVWIFCREATHSTPMYETGLKLLSITVLLTVANFDGSSTTIWCEPGFCTCANTTTVAAVIISSRISSSNWLFCENGDIFSFDRIFYVFCCNYQYFV